MLFRTACPRQLVRIVKFGPEWHAAVNLISGDEMRRVTTQLYRWTSWSGISIKK